jgi:hypothetical protein
VQELVGRVQRHLEIVLVLFPLRLHPNYARL